MKRGLWTVPHDGSDHMMLTPIASLPMYDRPDMQPAVNRLWAEIATRCRAAGLAAPDSLDRRADYASPWIDPGLVLSRRRCRLPVRQIAARPRRAPALPSTMLGLRRTDLSQHDDRSRRGSGGSRTDVARAACRH